MVRYVDVTQASPLQLSNVVNDTTKAVHQSDFDFVAKEKVDREDKENLFSIKVFKTLQLKQYIKIG